MPNNGNQQRIDTIILDLLRSSGKDFTADELEKSVSEKLQRDVDTFDVRKAIWRLVADKLAILTENRTLRVAP
jgi:hypothetical protein